MTYLLFFIDFIVSFLATFNALPLESLERFFCIYLKIITDLDSQMAHQQNWHQFREDAQSDVTKQPGINIHP
jgi:hypothetical protein